MMHTYSVVVADELETETGVVVGVHWGSRVGSLDIGGCHYMEGNQWGTAGTDSSVGMVGVGVGIGVDRGIQV